MRHNLVIFIGDELQAIADKAFQYMTYGNTPVLPYVHVYHLQKDSEAGIKSCRYTYAVEDADGDMTVTTDVERSAVQDSVVAIQNFIDEIFRTRVTLQTMADSAKMTVTVISGINVESRDLTSKIIDAATASTNRFKIDNLLLSPSIYRDVLSSTLTNGLDIKQVVDDLVAVKRANPTLCHIVCIDEYNAKGVSVNFSVQSLAYMLGEYSLLSAEHYRDMYPQALDSMPEYPVNALGMSVLCFNTDYFLKYLRRKTLLQVMDKEGVGITDIDINTASLESQKYLKKQVARVKEFWDGRIAALEGSGMAHDEIAAKADSEATQMFDAMDSDLMSLLDNERWSLPFKQAIVAQILSEDDESLKGTMFDPDQLILEDMTAEALDFFIDRENDVKTDYAQRCEACRQADKPIPPDPSVLDRPVDGKNLLVNPIPLIKRLRASIKTSMDYVRNAEDEIASLSKQLRDVEQGEKQVSEEGFVYGGVTYHLSPIVDKPLQETYAPLPKHDAQVDLRAAFTPIKRQRSLGACTAFALASVMEYVMKRASGKDFNLSELFLYYNARAIDGNENEDKGSSVYDGITTLSKEGICSEELSPYEVEHFNVKPADEAYNDALQRRVLEAKNVNRNLDDIRSALTEGYPVVISLKITNDFGRGHKGFVSVPTDDEIAEIEGSHAMVICGYSDNEKFFIVRNSWGTDFGDEGYCYIPYLYIADTRLLNAAYIVTKTTIDSATNAIKKAEKVSFNHTDANIQIAILNNLVAEERIHLAELNEQYSQVMSDYSYMMGRLQNGSTRAQIQKNSVDLNYDRIIKTELEEYLCRQQRQAELDELRRTRNKLLKDAAIAVGSLALGTLGSLLLLQINVVLWGVVAIGAIVLFVALYLLWYKKGQNAIRRRYDEELAQLASRKFQLGRQNELVRLQTHIYGLYINKFVKYRQRVSETYNKLRSFNLNLAAWQQIMAQKMQDLHPDEEIPFVPILDNDRLDKYFAENAAYLTDNLWLYPLLKEYNLDDESLKGLKDKLNKHVERSLRRKIEDFSIVKFVMSPDTYSYLRPESMAQRIALMEDRAVPFVRYKADIHNTSKPSNVFYAQISPDMRASFTDSVRRYCNNQPVVVGIDNPYKLVLVRNKNVAAL